MRALRLTGPETIVTDDHVPDPTLIDDHDALVRVERAGLCGSDLHPYFGREPVRFGTIPGHECVGTILDAGDALEGLSRGQRVIVPFSTSCGSCASCRKRLSARCDSGDLFGWRPPEETTSRLEDAGLEGAQAEILRVPHAPGTLVPIPDSIDADTALLLTDNFCTGWEGATIAGAAKDRSIAVVGCGAVGLSAVVAARHVGATVLAIDPVDDRREAAAGLGAEAITPDEVGAWLHAHAAVDGVVEAVGSSAAQRVAWEIAGVGATIAAMGVHNQSDFAFTPTELYDRNLTYRAGRASVRTTLETVLPQILSGDLEIPTETIVSETGVSLAAGADAYRRFADRRGGVRKIIFTPE